MFTFLSIISGDFSVMLELPVKSLTSFLCPLAILLQLYFFLLLGMMTCSVFLLLFRGFFFCNTWAEVIFSAAKDSDLAYKTWSLSWPLYLNTFCVVTPLHWCHKFTLLTIAIIKHFFFLLVTRSLRIPQQVQSKINGTPGKFCWCNGLKVVRKAPVTALKWEGTCVRIFFFASDTSLPVASQTKTAR